MIDPKHHQLIEDILVHAEKSTDQEILDYLLFKTKAQASVLEKLIETERPQCRNGNHIDFAKYSVAN